VAGAPTSSGPQHRQFLADQQLCRRWGFADGCAFDADGNLWVAIVFANWIVAMSPNGRATMVVEDRGGVLLSGPTSIAWGGQDMCDVYTEVPPL
jgi:gluconolactonase